MLFDTADYASLRRVLGTLHAACRLPNGDEDPSKAAQLMEVYALEIQLCTEQNDVKRLKPLYERACRQHSAVPAPRIAGIIHECGAKMYMREKNWEKARESFAEAFKVSGGA